jgi:N-acetylglucosaminyldiphosphoundecaprenol N-acetyl-beta-D-mannosaminyltransferase
MPTTKVKMLNVEMDNLTTKELLQEYQQGLLVTPNIDHLIKLQKDRDFYLCYQQAAYTVCDSRILYLLSKVLLPGNALRAQITGSDFFPAFCHYHSQKEAGAKVFLLGGTDESVQLAKDKINQRTNSQVVVAAYSPPFGFEKSEEETTKIINLIKNSGADTLAIGVGAPKQEKWVCAHRDKMPEIVRYLAIGATIEFESGNLRRAPRWMTRFGLEWLFRLSQEPKRLAKRYLLEDMPVFLLLMKQRIGVYKNPWKQ